MFVIDNVMTVFGTNVVSREENYCEQEIQRLKYCFTVTLITSNCY